MERQIALLTPPYPPGEPAEFTADEDFEQGKLFEAGTAADADEWTAAGDGLADENDGLTPARLVGGGRRKRGPRKKQTLALPAHGTSENISPEQRLLLLDTWRRSGLPAGDFASMVGVCKHTLYAWKRKFEEQGPSGLMDRPRGGPRGSKLHELILMLKQANPDWGCQSISDMLLRGPALPASASAVARVLHEAGYQVEEEPTRPSASPPTAARAGQPF